jgi:hypothetical protein
MSVGFAYISSAECLYNPPYMSCRTSAGFAVLQNVLVFTCISPAESIYYSPKSVVQNLRSIHGISVLQNVLGFDVYQS